ncbi:lipopolysaccharide transport system permease protein [Dysgonomonas hofstadii]|uniref:Transport permease protein n=1 Tax=Dysgonomonas hofstadii TaxID=637886 RepID=A0A840CNH6_9BACT|nr:ABC transporter permease [Dysgonomonas hofstadii]MBB4035074.1 lipopolysaccharide transport system permease protein [Dysgonomonas hofstadii]
MEVEKEHWDIIIKPKNEKFSLNYKEVWKYRDLVRMYIRRDIVTQYKQTILGPLWYVIQPLFTSLMYLVIFGNIANISTDGIPHIPFYMSGLLFWNYFSECMGRGSSTFAGNAGVFSKVYFPRLVVPISGLISGLLKLGIQFALFLGIYIYYINQGANINPNATILLFPLLILMSAFMGLGFGIIISSLTVKYRDLAILFGFLTQLWMYATPIAYPLSAIPNKVKSFRWIVELNPMTSIVETMRYSFMGEGAFSWWALGYSFVVTIVLVIFGSWIFNKMERKFIDIV